ncbi:hypothetical protein [Flavobacterium panici]|uniref:YcxB-like protein domain-containing protein n=1 Tax=Flavobacterium panici TaxID=2654843 RepID=A0A9N8P413_9FLAO|nr:hypothetical protein [Flavobacterium panici]CAC9976936.1 hypothetical protein FLAPXU55_04667 [Flavobacterium panici]
MKFELEFDKDIYNKQMDLLFDLNWKKKKDYYKNSQYLGLVLIIIGIALIYKRPNIFGIGYVFVFFGLTNLIPFIYYYFKIRFFYKRMEDVKVKEINDFHYLKYMNLEFTENALIATSGEHFNLIQWSELIHYIIKENNLILITKNYEPLILGEIEVGSENFEKIIAFVKVKFEAKE